MFELNLEVLEKIYLIYIKNKELDNDKISVQIL